MAMFMSIAQFGWLCLHPFPPCSAQCVIRQLRGVKEGLGSARFLATAHRYLSCTEARMPTPVPKGFDPTLPPPFLNQHAPSYPSANLSSPLPLLPYSACKSTPWMMDYSVTAACEGLICFIDFSLGRMPASAASHLFPKTRSCNRR